MNDELKHYGVKGMKWSVNRASKKLDKSKDPNAREKAIETLQKHKEKVTAELAGLAQELEKLEDKAEDLANDNDIRARNLELKADKKRLKAKGAFTSDERADKLNAKADKLTEKSNKRKAKSEKVQRKIAENKELTKQFEQGLKDINEALAKKGRKFVNEIRLK